MHKINHFNIPIFIPHAACPHQCLFCNQKKISGTLKPPSEDEIHFIIKSHLLTMPEESDIEIAFFGGSFTALSAAEQEKYLEIVQPYLNTNKVKGIRLSTRPDYINDDILSNLKKYNVKVIELGAQSMDDDVLIKSERGHTSDDVVNASKMVKEYGFALGLQIMVGLPGDNRDKSLYTANKIVELGAECARIYPVIVIKGTELENLYHNNAFVPMPLTDAVQLTAEILQIFEIAGINVIRVGLHPSEGLLSGESIVAGPFHQSFRELVITEIWKKIFDINIMNSSGSEIIISVSPEQYNFAIGNNGRNKKMLKTKFKKVIFEKDPSLHGRNFHVDYLNQSGAVIVKKDY
ncbi:MAG: radical SAM protein, partial [Spirochaetes bacterium]|nr:radical SAM protein [Spirochaetota bacterium]